MVKVGALALLVCAIAGCQAKEAVPDDSASSHSLGEAAAAAADTAAQSTARDSAATAAGQVLLALDGEGLRLVVEATGSTRLLPFGMESSAVFTALSKIVGAPTSRGENPDCGAGPIAFAIFADGLSIALQENRFVGWSARANPSEASLTTMSGIGIGSTRAALDSVYAADVSKSSLGFEFVTGGLAGVLDGESGTAHITNLWAGVSCIAR